MGRFRDSVAVDFGTADPALWVRINSAVNMLQAINGGSIPVTALLHMTDTGVVRYDVFWCPRKKCHVYYLLREDYVRLRSVLSQARQILNHNGPACLESVEEWVYSQRLERGIKPYGGPFPVPAIPDVEEDDGSSGSPEQAGEHHHGARHA